MRTVKAKTSSSRLPAAAMHALARRLASTCGRTDDADLAVGTCRLERLKAEALLPGALLDTVESARHLGSYRVLGGTPPTRGVRHV